MNDQHSWVGTGLSDHIPVIAGTLLSSRPSPQRLFDWKDVVINRLRKSDHCQAIVILRQKSRKVCRRRIRIVPTNCMKYIDAVLYELIGCDFLRVLSFTDQSTLDAVFNISQLNSAISDGRSTKAVKKGRLASNLRINLNGVAEKKAFIATSIGDNFNRGINLVVALNQTSNSRT